MPSDPKREALLRLGRALYLLNNEVEEALTLAHIELLALAKEDPQLRDLAYDMRHHMRQLQLRVVSLKHHLEET